MNKPNEIIIVLDFGGQYNQLIARRIRELGVYSELMPYNTSAKQLREMNPQGIIFSGGPASVLDEASPTVDPRIYELGIPILGIGYGMQLMAHQLQGKVEQVVEMDEVAVMDKVAVAEQAEQAGRLGKAGKLEYGKMEIHFTESCPLALGLESVQQVWMSCGVRIGDLPSGFVADASGKYGPVAMSNKDKKLYALQFHPEAQYSLHGQEMIQNFLLSICGCTGQWSMQSFLDEAISDIRDEVGDRKVLCALSGGVDSSVVAMMLHRAIGEQLTCMFIDHGLLRKGEAESVMETFVDKFEMHVVKIDAQQRFMTMLSGISDPEQKRKIIGTEFIRVFEQESTTLGDFDFLAQGTLYTDIIESGTATAQTIKSHHNVGGLPKDMKFKLIEPLKALFKDEVRVVGDLCGLPEVIVMRQPFPGPGLAIRVLGEVTEEKLHIVRESDAILREEIGKAGLHREIWQYFTALPNVKSVGISEDVRTYSHTVGIRAVTSIDGMTADWARVPYDVLEIISNRIVNEVDHVNRVVFDITSKPPATIEWE